MRNRSKLALAALSAAMLLAVVVSVASANRLATSNQAWRATFTPMTFTGGGSTVRCNVTLEGSFHSRTISKVVGQLVGYVTKATVSPHPCTGGDAEAAQESLPWHLRYNSFTGTLPNITTIVVEAISTRFWVESEIIGFGFRCFYRTNIPGTINREAGGAITTMRFNKTGIATESGFPCPSGNLEGTGNVTLQGTTTKITVTLVQ
jgi:hypothetical protein